MWGAGEVSGLRALHIVGQPGFLGGESEPVASQAVQCFTTLQCLDGGLFQEQVIADSQGGERVRVVGGILGGDDQNIGRLACGKKFVGTRKSPDLLLGKKSATGPVRAATGSAAAVIR